MKIQSYKDTVFAFAFKVLSFLTTVTFFLMLESASSVSSLYLIDRLCLST